MIDTTKIQVMFKAVLLYALSSFEWECQVDCASDWMAECGVGGRQVCVFV